MTPLDKLGFYTRMAYTQPRGTYVARRGLFATIRNSVRTEEIVMTLLRFGLGDLVHRIRLGRLGRMLFKKSRVPVENLPHNRSVRLRLALEALGPTFIKLGQILSNRADILPAETIVELSKLQDSCQPVPMEELDVVIQDELGETAEKLFVDFNRVPMASASIAQVHEAWLPNGSRVAVKIQRPGISRIIEQDLDVLDFFAGMVQRHIPEARHFDPVGLIVEFRKQITQELDFNREAHHLEQFSHTHKGDDNLVIPRVYESYSKHRVLTLQYIQGTKLKDILDSKGEFDRPLLAKRLANSMLEQIFIHGFFHADPHPGNILVLPDSRVCFLDFGMMGKLSSREREQLARVMMGMAGNDAQAVTESLEDILGYIFENHDAFQAEVQDLIDIYMNRPLGEINIARVLDELMNIMRAFEIIIPSKFMLIARAFMISEGVAFKLSPEFSFMSVFGPFSRRLILEQLKPRNIRRKIAEQGEAYGRVLRDLPLDSAQILRLLKRGDLKVGFKVQGLEPLKDTIDTVGTRFTFGLVLAATLISSSLIIRSDVPPLIYGIPALGFIGFAIAGIMSIGFLLDLILRIIRRAKKGD